VLRYIESSALVAAILERDAEALAEIRELGQRATSRRRWPKPSARCSRAASPDASLPARTAALREGGRSKVCAVLPWSSP
jgi:hypothetical protein